MSSTVKPWKLRVRHMLEAIASCRNYVEGLTQEELGARPQALHAIAWNLTILGEAARHVPAEVANRYPEIVHVHCSSHVADAAQGRPACVGCGSGALMGAQGYDA